MCFVTDNCSWTITICKNHLTCRNNKANCCYNSRSILHTHTRQDHSYLPHPSHREWTWATVLLGPYVAAIISCSRTISWELRHSPVDCSIANNMQSEILNWIRENYSIQLFMKWYIVLFVHYVLQFVAISTLILIGSDVIHCIMSLSAAQVTHTNRYVIGMKNIGHFIWKKISVQIAIRVTASAPRLDKWIKFWNEFNDFEESLIARMSHDSWVFQSERDSKSWEPSTKLS